MTPCNATRRFAFRIQTEAVKWFRIAAKDGDKDAQMALGFSLEHGADAAGTALRDVDTRVPVCVRAPERECR